VNPGLIIRGWWKRVLGGKRGTNAVSVRGAEGEFPRGSVLGSGSRGAPTPTDLEMMTRALELARAAAERGEVPVGAVVYRTGPAGPEILGEGRNTRERDKNPAGHAEFLAIQHACERLADWRLEGCTLVVTLEPCPMCAGLIVNARVPRVVYGAADPKAGAVASLFSLLNDPRLNHRCEVLAGVRADESAMLLRHFFRGLRSKSSRLPNKTRSK